jgi:hypothetical protein
MDAVFWLVDKRGIRFFLTTLVFMYLKKIHSYEQTTLEVPFQQVNTYNKTTIKEHLHNVNTIYGIYGFWRPFWYLRSYNQSKDLYATLIFTICNNINKTNMSISHWSIVYFSIIKKTITDCVLNDHSLKLSTIEMSESL